MCSTEYVEVYVVVSVGVVSDGVAKLSQRMSRDYGKDFTALSTRCLLFAGKSPNTTVRTSLVIIL